MLLMTPMVLLTALNAAAPPSHKPRVLVFPVTTESAAHKGLATSVDVLLVRAAARAPGVDVRSIKDVQAVMAFEQQQQLLGCNGPSCAADLAGALDAEQLIHAQLSLVGQDVLLNASRIRSRDGVSLARVSNKLPAEPAQLEAAINNAANALMADELSPEISVTLRVLCKRKGQPKEEVLLPGATLSEGDQVAFDLSVTPGAHVYLVQRTRASGSVTVLYPQPDIDVQNPLPAGTRVRIPSGTDHFEVDNQDLGTEQVFVLASPHALPRLSEAVARLAQDATLVTHRRLAEDAMLALLPPATGAQKVCKSLDGPGCAGRSRALTLKASGKERVSASLRSAPGDDALFYTFAFEHVAAPTTP